jgi:subtilase family serine protease
MGRPRKCALTLVIGLAAVTGPGALAAGPPARRVGSAPALPPGANIAGQVSGATRMQLAVALQPRDPSALESFATAVSTPGSPLYRHYITPAQFAQRFAPPSAQIEAVESSLRAHGLEPGPLSANHLSIPVTASAGGIERAFSLTLERVGLAGRRASAIINTVAPRLDGSIAGLVQGVVGLSSAATPKPLYVRPHGARLHATRHVATGGPQPCSAARAAAPSQAAYTADQIASAYGFSSLYGSGDEGRGQTVALYELEPYASSDIAAYQSCYGTHASVSNISVDGGAGGGPGQGEAALDIEQVIGLAPRATVLVYEGPNSASSSPGSGYYDTWSTLIGQDRARVVSASWGQCESLVPPSDAAAEGTLFQEAAAQGQTIFSAAGDEGSEDCNGQTGLLPNTQLAVDDPSSQPFVSGVGGTTLESLGPRPSERVWNSGGGLCGLLGCGVGAGGGGRSSLWAMPSYQSGAPSFLHVAQSNSREMPDVSADADPNTGYLIYWNGSGTVSGPVAWQGIGGTSAAAPVWASAIALINASNACGGALVGFANPALYTAAANRYGQDFNDITSGNNDFTGTNGGRYTAAAGFDMASGLGTPNASALIGTLCTNAHRIGSPKISGHSLSGVAKRRPTLRLTITAGRAAPGLRTISIRLPSALRLAHRAKQVTVSGARGARLRFSAAVKNGVLTVRLRHATTLAKVTVRYATLTVTRHEASAARRGRAGKLGITVTVTDAHGKKTNLHTSLRPR